MERGNKNNGLQEQIHSVNLSVFKHNIKTISDAIF